MANIQRIKLFGTSHDCNKKTLYIHELTATCEISGGAKACFKVALPSQNAVKMDVDMLFSMASTPECKEIMASGVMIDGDNTYNVTSIKSNGFYQGRRIDVQCLYYDTANSQWKNHTATFEKTDVSIGTTNYTVMTIFTF